MDATTQVFWGEIAPCDHVLELYDEESKFLDTLSEFVCAGFKAGDTVVLIATPSHLNALKDLLIAKGMKQEDLADQDRYLCIEADEALSSFMVNGWPDEDRFKQLVTNVVTKAQKKGRRVRAFGEMVAVLWARGEHGATVRLEHLWHAICRESELSLFCAYPKTGFTDQHSESLQKICAAHHKVFTTKNPGSITIH